MASLLAKICSEWLRKRENKKRKNVPMSSCPARNRKIKKKWQKYSKKLKNTIVGSFQAKTSRGRPRKRGKKNKKKQRK